MLAPAGGTNTITFASSLSGSTITLAGVELPAISGVSNAGSMTISGCTSSGNTGPAGPEGFTGAGTLNSVSNYNLIGDGSGGLAFGINTYQNLGGTTASPLNPLLAPLGNYGGPTETMALLPGSPAINAGSNSYGGGTDQRGDSRYGATDIGAFESQGFTITITNGNNQSTTVDTAFADPLVVTVAANNPVEPVANGEVTFTAPATGTSTRFLNHTAVALIASDGQASVSTSANNVAGSYSVIASANGATSASFSLTNTA